MAIFGYDQDAWDQLSPEQRLQAYLNSPGHSAQASQLALQAIRNPEIQGNLALLANSGNNYNAKLLESVANNTRAPKPVNIPGAESGIGVMSGDASADIGGGYRQTVQNYGPDPRQNKTPDPNQVQDWTGHLGQEVGNVTGFGDYRPQYDENGNPTREWKAIMRYHPAWRGY